MFDTPNESDKNGIPQETLDASHVRINHIDHWNVVVVNMNKNASDTIHQGRSNVGGQHNENVVERVLNRQVLI